MQPDASSQRKIPVQQRTYQILLSVFILFTKLCYSPLLLTTVSFFLLTIVSKVLDKSMLGYTRSLVVYNQVLSSLVTSGTPEMQTLPVCPSHSDICACFICHIYFLTIHFFHITS